MKAKTAITRLAVIGLLVLMILGLASVAQAAEWRPLENRLPMYRLWNPYITDHFYTTDAGEAYNA